jgi:outer membrane protein TolC
MKTFVLYVVAVLVIVPTSVRAQSPLTLAEAERLAIEHAPSFKHYSTNVTAAAERVVHEGRLPDPQLTLGAINVPTDSFSLTQDDMTMVGIGVRQVFPPGDTLGVRTRRAEHGLVREQARLEVERRALLRQVRSVWYELYAAEHSLLLLAQQRQLAQRELEAAEGRYRAAQETQRAVLRARQAVARVNEREPMLRAQATQRRAQLARWIGDAAQAALPQTPPALALVPAAFEPTEHPEWRATQAEVEGTRAEVDLARQEYKPGVMFDLMYGARRERPDMVTAMISVDLPIFREKRQDRRLAERQAREAAARHDAEDKRRELQVMHAAMRAQYEAAAARVRIFEEQLLPSLEREAQLTVAGFARDQMELREARMKELDARLELVRLRADLARSHAELLYLIGESQP